METAGINWSKFDVGKAVEELNEKEKTERLGQIEMIRELQIKKYIRRKREEKKEQKRVDEECEKIEKIRTKEERRAEKVWRKQKEFERRREERRQIVIEERKCFGCRGFGHVACHCRNMGVEGPAPVPSNKFEVLKDRVM